VFDPRLLSELPQRSLGKSVHLGKKQNSGFGLPPIAVIKKNFFAASKLRFD